MINLLKDMCQTRSRADQPIMLCCCLQGPRYSIPYFANSKLDVVIQVSTLAADLQLQHGQ